jgi:hypothetical protein
MLDYASLEDVHGSGFKQNAPMQMSEVVRTTVPTLPLDSRADVIPPTVAKSGGPVGVDREERGDRGGDRGDRGGDDKLNKILKLVEQNKTGYESASSQDMLLYILTGVVFLFTFDTFVTLGKGMH